MAPTWIETDSNPNKDIRTAVSVGVYTSTGDKFVMPQLLADQVAGGGDYVYYVTLQVAGAGSHYVIGPKTTHTAAAGETALGAQGGFIAVRTGDVLTVYIDGLAGDETTPDVTVRWFELDASANVTSLNGETTPVDNLVLALGTGGLVDKLNSMLEVAGLAYRFTAEALVEGPSGSGLTAQETANAVNNLAPVGVPVAGSIGDRLDDILTYGGGSGTGSYTDTIKDPNNNPLDGARVQLSTDAAGTHRVYEAFTNALGVFVMNPDPGTYYRWIDLAGYTDRLTQGAQVTVT